jgi:pentatricopeptide repeat protein
MLPALRFAITRHSYEKCSVKRIRWFQPMDRMRAFSAQTPAQIRRHRRGVLTKYLQSNPKLDNVTGSLSKDIISYLEKLESYTEDSTDLGDLKLKQHLKALGDDPETSRLLIKKSLQFEEKHPDARKLVDNDCFFCAILTCVRSGQVEQADELLTLCDSLDHIQPHRKCYSLVMIGYAKRKTPEALKRIRQIVKELENHRYLATRTAPLDRYSYNILMNAYIGVLGETSLNFVRPTLNRMRMIAARLSDDTLLPDFASYTALLKALILKRNPRFEYKVDRILLELKSNDDYVERPAKDRLYVENMAMYAWSKSDDPQAPERARQIFDAMDEQDTVAYNTMCHLYGKIGDFDAAFLLFQEMQTKFESGSNKNCRPDMHTNATILNLLLKSNREDAAAEADKIFHAISLPNTVTCNTYSSILAKNGDIEKTVRLLRRMQSDFDSGKNKTCCPDMHTYATILSALHKSNRPDTATKARQIFATIPNPNTVVYNTLLNIFAERGEGRYAVHLARHMQVAFDSGTNPNCKPNDATRRTLRKALQTAKDNTIEELGKIVMLWFRKNRPPRSRSMIRHGASR